MKRAYKLQEFVAHASDVNCLKIGKKSSRVLVTGGEDHKVNMWAIGKPNAILSLAGHTSAVESVTFDTAEVVVVAGAASGTIKLWDLEEAKIVRTLTGHRSNCISVDFHPFGEFFASGSLDTNLKIWDIRRKGCIHTYKGHTRGINSIKFSPDGRWVVSGGEDNIVKLWDLTAGKLMHDFKYHEGQVQCLDFHPHEFLLATGSADRTVKFFDLETFELIGSAGPESAGVRSMVFNPDGRTVLCAMQDSLKVFSWEPLRCHDLVDVGWHKLADLCIHEEKLLGCSFNQSCVGVWVVDLQRVAPYQNGSAGWKDGPSVGFKVDNDGNQTPQEVRSVSHPKTDASASLPHMIDVTMKNVKITPAKETSSSHPPQTAPNSGRRPANILTTVPATPTPTIASRRSSIAAPKATPPSASSFRFSSRSDANAGGSPRLSTASDCEPGLDDTRPTVTAGGVSMSTSKSHDRDLDNVDGNGDGASDAFRTDPIPHVNRSSSARRPDSSGHGSASQYGSRSNLISHLGTKEDDATVNWNGSRSYSSRRSSSFDVPLDNNLGRSHSFSDESSRNQATRNATGTEASTTVGTTKALLAQWERKEKPRLPENSAFVEKPVVVEKSMPEPRSYVVEKSASHEAPSGGGGVKTLGLDINSFVPKGSSLLSERKISAAKQDTEIIEELLLQHHTMASIMQSRLTNMQVVRRFWNKNDMKGAIEAMKKMTDHSVQVEVLSVFMEKSDLLTLEICYLLIPLLNGLLSTDNDRFLMTALELLGKLVETFGPIIHATRTSAPSIGVDLQAEQRLERCNMCYHELQAVGHSLLPLMRKGGDLTKAARNLQEALGRV
ncbi:katanin p80 WD40 repeat-containing subunit B1 homolog KTN80.4 isoform X2 [Physcomitrium patens]|uniref:Katanin p80 WD40 repeat-containing subunit B1 homolog n=1 Tax=Physcomitrium patens TaxID=3218 RepID=A0A7I4C274_PHYPA|nr:katanin p80 WD40 repeat-containing subunit B1 homolog isoform X2 [Physcomitrium patens]|eukprot:XP_024357566.1 katanin p80 WD40 repeat-containing subunit B1 homolog isoform X2 [Physcomitrella patens]